MGLFVQTNYLSNYLSNYLCSLFVLMRFLRLTFSCSCSARHGCTLLHITTRGYHELILIFERKKLKEVPNFFRSLLFRIVILSLQTTFMLDFLYMYASFSLYTIFLYCIFSYGPFLCCRFFTLVLKRRLMAQAQVSE